MIQLAEKYNKNSYQFKIIERDDETAIAEQWDGKEFVAYEVFIIKKRADTQIFENFSPAREVVPSDEDWGTLGYTCHTIEEANQKRKVLRKFLKDAEKRRNESA